jgi:hypothetical protein
MSKTIVTEQEVVDAFTTVISDLTYQEQMSILKKVGAHLNIRVLPPIEPKNPPKPEGDHPYA